MPGPFETLVESSYSGSAIDWGYLEPYDQMPAYVRSAMTELEYLTYEALVSLDNQRSRRPYRPNSEKTLEFLKSQKLIKNKANILTDTGRAEFRRLKSKRDAAEHADIQRELADVGL